MSEATEQKAERLTRSVSRPLWIGVATLVLVGAAVCRALWSRIPCLAGVAFIWCAAGFSAEPLARTPLDALPAAPLAVKEFGVVGVRPSAQYVAVIGEGRLRHWGPIHQVVASPDGRLFATSGSDGAARIWDLVTGNELHCLSDRGVMTGIAFSPDGKLLATACRVLNSPTFEARVVLWDTQTGMARRVIAGTHFGQVVAFSPDGARLAAAGFGMAYVFDVATGNERLRIAAHSTGDGRYYTISATAFSPDGEILVTSGFGPVAAGQNVESLVKFWDSHSGVLHASMPGAVGASPFLRDGALVVRLADGAVVLWDPKNDRELRRFSEPRDNIGDPIVSPDGFAVAATHNDRSGQTYRQSLQLWDVASANKVRDVNNLPHTVQSLAFTSDSRTIATGGMDGHVHLWDVNTGQPKRPASNLIEGLITLAFSPDETVVALGKRDGSLIFWDVASRKIVATIRAHPERLRAIAYSSDGRTLATGGDERRFYVWDVTTKRKLATLKVAAGPIVALRFSADGKMLAAGTGGGKTEIFDVELWKFTSLVAGENRPVRSVAFDRQGKVLAIACGKTITLHEIATGVDRFLETPELIDTMDLRADGRLVAAGLSSSGRVGEDPRILVWNTTNPIEPAVLEADEGTEVNSLAFSPDGRRVASVGNDGIVRLWDPLQAALIDSITVGPAAGRIYKVVYSPSGRHLATLNGNGTVAILRIGAGQN